MAMASAPLLFVLVSLFSASVLASDYCVYTIFTKTGFLPKSGTDANVNTMFYDAYNNTVSISNITTWGGAVMGPNHNFFERNQVDVFTGLGECLDTPICRLNLTTDGSGPHHGWYCDYLEVTSTSSKPGNTCSTHHFSVKQWLATDAYPYSLSSVRDDCDYIQAKRSAAASQ